MTLAEKMKEKKLETITFADEKLAIAALMKEKGHCSFKHILSPKQKTIECKHRSDAWIILPNGMGRCIISVEGFVEEPFEFFQNQTTAVFVPAHSRYYLEALSDISFAVFGGGLN